ncbi:SlyX family protein (plasmid) [Paroceanicella profunda]|uniref:SlyX family protein n=1 Tax=Paroceanicella profunda TaxID=2579971 RepID=A0A5B8FYY9_9RHOB|nr:SlyX family protein [Paroceanicella profunda]QDL94126.1 SlyX family protein [Paroceanicella profunda]
MTDTTQRLTDLEIHVAHQEMVITELSETVSRQWSEIDMLKRSLTRLVERLNDRADSGDAPPAHQPPPHW